ncbi:unnamed protein product [Cylindrotheca closterium]|uniref:FAS1 domain-containing protein n=1 Tax=Cylindrotheca closterium TaxID=2856 RepID=A0AAD2JGV9_9STRA|nr:unnamed protein product [Cylindrotheca closterium]
MKLSAVALLAATIGIATAQNGTEPFAADFSPIAENGSYLSLLSAIAATGSDTLISANAPVTMFGPWDEAFDNITDVLETLSAEETQGILLNHVIIGVNVTTDMLKEEGCISATTAGGLEVSIFRDPFTGDIDFDGIFVVDPNITGDYGVMHGIDGVLIAEEHESLPCPVPVDFSPIEQLGDYSTLLAAIFQTNNNFTIASNAGDFSNTTIFGPSDAAFAAIQSTVDELTEDMLNDVLWGHMAHGEVFFEEVLASGCIEVDTFAGTPLAVRGNRTTGTASVNGIPISSTAFDVAGVSYVFHGIEGVLVDSEFVPCSEDPLDFFSVAQTGNYSTLLSLISQTGLDDELSEVRPVTILAPTDAVFERYQSSLTGLSDEDLLLTLRLHAIANVTIDSEWIAWSGCQEWLTIGGMMVSLRYDNVTETITVNGFPLVQTDIAGNFGILHGIDGLTNDGAYEPCQVDPYSRFELLTFIYQQNITEALESLEVPTTAATFFRPIDEAFNSLDEYPFEGDDWAEKEVELMLKHIVPEIYSADDVKEAGCVILDTLAGTKIRLMWMEDAGNVGGRRLAGHMGGEMTGMVMVNDAMVILADQLNEESEAMFHGIDKVLAPGSFSECPPDESSMSPMASPTDAPASPTTDAPASPTTNAPASPTTNAPASPTTNAPASPSTPSTGAPAAESSAFINGLSIIFVSMVALVAF